MHVRSTLLLYTKMIHTSPLRVMLLSIAIVAIYKMRFDPTHNSIPCTTLLSSVGNEAIWHIDQSSISIFSQVAYQKRIKIDYSAYQSILWVCTWDFLANCYWHDLPQFPLCAARAQEKLHALYNKHIAFTRCIIGIFLTDVDPKMSLSLYIITSS